MWLMRRAVMRRAVMRQAAAGALPGRAARGLATTGSGASASTSVRVEEEGQLGTLDFRMRFFYSAHEAGAGVSGGAGAGGRAGLQLSPWHDIPVHAQDQDRLLHFVAEIPKFSRQKMEIKRDEAFHPIAQDVTKQGMPREYPGCIYWNYGFVPQTWEDPDIAHPVLAAKGDNDPLDVVEIGARKMRMGEVSVVKPLGALAMIDDGEVDWKILAINVDDPLASQLHDRDDVARLCTGVIDGVREWFRWYKTPDGKPLNEFGFDEALLSRGDTEAIVRETHEYWRGLLEDTDAARARAASEEIWIPSYK